MGPARGRLPRRAAWAAAAAAAFLAGAVIGPVAASATSARPRAAAQRVATSARFPRLDHIFVIMMENTSYAGLLPPSNPDTAYIRHLAGRYGLESDDHGVTHVSMPNYIAASCCTRTSTRTRHGRGTSFRSPS